MTTHRTPEARIAALEAQIERIKTRAERAKVRKDPTLRHMRAAVRQIDKAASACGDRVVRGELLEARTRIAACLALGMGLEAVPPRGAGSGGNAATQDSPASAALLAFVANHPGQTEKAVAAALRTDLDGLHALTRPLIAAGRMRVRVAPVTRYWGRGAVSEKGLRLSGPRLAARVCTHLEVEDLREAADALDPFAAGRTLAAGVQPADGGAGNRRGLRARERGRAQGAARDPERGGVAIIRERVASDHRLASLPGRMSPEESPR